MGVGGSGGDALGAAMFGPGELDAPSDGATLTFQDIGAPGWFPSIREPGSGMCDVVDTAACCLTKDTITGSDLTPWDRDLIMTLRGPIDLKQIAVYHPDAGDPSSWSRTAAWDSRDAGSSPGMTFDGNAFGTSGTSPFAGEVGSECLVNVATDTAFPCGPGSSPFCKVGSKPKDYGWKGSKLFVLLASMPHDGGANVAAACSKTTTGNWYDAPWIGLSLGELVRAGSFASCQCYAKDLAKGYLADGCGQFNVFEVVNDNNSFKNLDVFSTDMIGYAGYVGEGPCGPKCDASKLAPEVDLIDKKTFQEAANGAISTPSKGPGAAFRRPEAGYRYFLILLDVASRSVQLGIVHPSKIPMPIAPLLPALPGKVGNATIGEVLQLRLPH